MKYGEVRTMLLNELDADQESTATTDVEFRGVQNLFTDAKTDMFEICVASYSFETNSDVETYMYIEAPDLLQPYSFDSRTKASSKNIGLVGIDTTTGNDVVVNANGGTSYKTIVKRPNGDVLRLRLIGDDGNLVGNISAGWVVAIECRPVYCDDDVENRRGQVFIK
jgi:hypothetical protein|tara:strand:- start:2213 stop:2710 length:498 start_codon:yes stop_codon:yes gene_type:complete